MIDELLKEKPVVIIVGNIPDIPDLIGRIYNKYKITPILFAPRRPVSLGIITKYKFKRMEYPDNEYYILHTLLDLHSDTPSHTCILLTGNGFPDNMLKNLESSFIIKKHNELFLNDQ